ncbi:MAG TPA: acyl-CoA dehydrogenase family protein [Caulobacteraceae bacterium]|jgi:alkylation response protein AidB-like acyl-CoA dehydrogenase
MKSLSVEERTAIQDSVKRLLADHSTEADVRRAMETPEGYDPELWRRLADLGVVGLIVDEAYGGVGAGPEELERVMEEAGAALLSAPLLSSAVLAAGLIQALGDDSDKARLLPSIADGSRIATVALAGPRGGWSVEDVAVRASASGETWRLDGETRFVAFGQVADLILVVARSPDGPAVFEVERGASGLSLRALPTFDHTQRLADLRFEATPARRLISSRPAWEAVEEALDLARIALAGEQAGGARRVLEFTVEYAKTRVQFGRSIGSFQAIKHMAADLLLESESAISAARAAAKSLADGAEDTRAAISLAAFACADAFTQVAATAIQMHGGIAFTWAHPAHLYLRRARADAQLFDPPHVYRERYLEALGA